MVQPHEKPPPWSLVGDVGGQPVGLKFWTRMPPEYDNPCCWARLLDELTVGL